MSTTVSDSIADALFGKTRRNMLGTFFSNPDAEFYMRQIVRLTGSGRGAVQRELENLLEAGIITRRELGRMSLYTVNKSSPVYSELKSFVLKTVGAADVLQKALECRSADIKIAFIFGSVAKGTENRASDIDLMVVGNITFGDVVDLIAGAEESLNREVNPMVYSLPEFARRLSEDHYFVNEVLAGDKIFIIGGEDELQSLAGKGLDKRT